MDLQDLPRELFDLIIEQLVLTIGIARVVRHRLVSRNFNTAIQHAICDVQVLDIFDPDTPSLIGDISPRLRSKIFATKARSDERKQRTHLMVIHDIVQGLRLYAPDENTQTIEGWYERVATAMKPPGAWRYATTHVVDQDLQDLHLLCGAVELGDIGLLMRLVADRPAVRSQVNERTPYFFSPLTLAAAGGRTELVEFLISLGACTVQRPKMAASSHWRVKTNDDQLDFNIQDGYNRNIALAGSDGPLSTAAICGHIEILNILLKPENCPPTTSLDYLSAIRSAAAAGRYDLITIVFKAIGKTLADVPALGLHMITAAARGGHTGLVQQLLDDGADVNCVFDSCSWPNGEAPNPLRAAACAGNLSMVRFLLAHGALAVFPEDEDSNDPDTVRKAAARGHIEIVHTLIDHGADPHQAFSGAAVGGQSTMIESLLHRFPLFIHSDEGNVGRILLLAAVANARNLTTVRLLVEAGVSLNDGYSSTDMIPLNVVKSDPTIPFLMIDFLFSLGAKDTNEAILPRERDWSHRNIILSQRSLEWISP